MSDTIAAVVDALNGFWRCWRCTQRNLEGVPSCVRCRCAREQ